MVEGWKAYEGKKVYIQTKSNRHYSGTIITVDISTKPFIWVTIIDKFDKHITFAHSEIELIQEEGT